MNLVELTDYLVKSLVKDPSTVLVTKEDNSDSEVIIKVVVPDSEMGAVIGKGGKIANSIRTIVQAAAYTTNEGHVRINIDTK